MQSVFVRLFFLLSSGISTSIFLSFPSACIWLILPWVHPYIYDASVGVINLPYVRSASSLFIFLSFGCFILYPSFFIKKALNFFSF